jgi:hypothetical protein
MKKKPPAKRANARPIQFTTAKEPALYAFVQAKAKETGRSMGGYVKSLIYAEMAKYPM